MWGRGRDLARGEIVGGSVGWGDVPEHLCGGMYRRGRRKRKRGGKGKEELSWREKKERRILKKFGAGGKPWVRMRRRRLSWRGRYEEGGSRGWRGVRGGGI